MTGPSHIISPSVLYLTTVISEIHLVWPIVLYWADNEARRTGKSGRSQVSNQGLPPCLAFTNYTTVNCLDIHLGLQVEAWSDHR